MLTLALSASTQRGPAFDELAHLTAGVTYVEYGDFRFHPENGLLPQALAGLPLAMDDAITPPPSEGPVWDRSDVWTAGRRFLFGQQVPWSALLLRGRLMILGLAVVLALVIWRLSRRLWGAAGGLFSLALFALSPEVLAHGAMVTSDLCAALFFLLATVSLWELLGQVDVKRVAAAGGALAGLALSKASAVLVGPIGVLLLGVRFATRSAAPSRRLALGVLGAGFIAWAGVWAGYGFRASTFAGDAPVAYNKPLEPMLERTGALEGPIRWALDVDLLPEAWLYGFTFVLAHSDARPAFLRGDHRDEGWWWFFPYTFLVKTPLTLLALLLVGLVLSLRGGRSSLVRLTPFLVLFMVYWGFSVTSHLNIGMRHLLPTLPPLVVLAGAGGRALTSGGPVRLALVGVLAALLIEVGAAWPRYLAFMNPLGGGAKDGWQSLVDSSLDWGQDGPALADALQRMRREDELVFLAWFGSSDPRRFGVQAEPLPSFMQWAPPGDPVPLRPGLYAVSATQLQGVYLTDRGAWTDDKEARYQAGRALWRDWLLASGDDVQRAQVAGAAGGLAALRARLEEYANLRFLRLAVALREREPDGRAGRSVLIYRLTEPDLQAALGGQSPRGR